MNNYYLVKDGDRIFWVPLLLGGLGGAAIASTIRPRPVYVNPPMYQVNTPYPMYPGNMGYGGYSYSNSGYNYFY